jgi:hypothetical protein
MTQTLRSGSKKDHSSTGFSSPNLTSFWFTGQSRAL